MESWSQWAHNLFETDEYSGNYNKITLLELWVWGDMEMQKIGTYPNLREWGREGLPGEVSLR